MSATYLDKIVEYKQQELAAVQRKRSLNDVRVQADDQEPARVFRQQVLQVASERPSIIAEAKKASPSKGLIVPDFNPVEIAHIYADFGAAAMSVLTDEHFFQGQLRYLQEVKSAVSLPVLRKDFTLNQYHIYEARAAQADAILLIARILEADQLADYRSLANELGMTTLIELHDQADADKVLQGRSVSAFDNSLLGINSRNLATFKTDLAVAEQLRTKIPLDIPVIAESGIHSAADIKRLRGADMNIFLIGEALLVAPHIGEKLTEFIEGGAD